VTDTLAAILAREPDWQALPETTPPTIQRLLQHCVEKNPRDRLRDIGDARTYLEDAGSFRSHLRTPVVAQEKRASRHNLPGELTSFIGRRAELDELARVLASSRLLSLTGAGGAGKTRLALRLALDAVRRFADGVWLVDLAPIASPDLVAQAIASAVGVREAALRSIPYRFLYHPA